MDSDTQKKVPCPVCGRDASLKTAEERRSLRGPLINQFRQLLCDQALCKPCGIIFHVPRYNSKIIALLSGARTFSVHERLRLQTQVASRQECSADLEYLSSTQDFSIRPALFQGSAAQKALPAPGIETPFPAPEAGAEPKEVPFLLEVNSKKLGFQFRLAFKGGIAKKSPNIDVWQKIADAASSVMAQINLLSKEIKKSRPVRKEEVKRIESKKIENQRDL